MTETQKTKRIARLDAAVTRAAGRYNLAKATRADRGQRIESAAEAKARRALEAAREARRTAGS